MLALQKFYGVQIEHGQPPREETFSPSMEKQLFIEIARRFGLIYWLEDGIKAVFESS